MQTYAVRIKRTKDPQLHYKAFLINFHFQEIGRQRLKCYLYFCATSFTRKMPESSDSMYSPTFMLEKMI